MSSFLFDVPPPPRRCVYILYYNVYNYPYSVYFYNSSTVLYKQIENSDENIFVDLATYPTTDYTYSGHSEFTYRIEILIYKDINPLSTLYETNLDNL